MKLGITNKNYCFTVIKVGKDIPLEGKDRIVHKNIFGNMVITQKDSLPEGTLALYIPVETQLSEDYCKYNNLYDKAEMNFDTTKRGYISHKRRIRAIKLGGFESNGMLMPIDSIYWQLPSNTKPFELEEGTEFDTIDGIELCRKYVVPVRNSNPVGKRPKKAKVHSKLVDNQFRLHVDTSQLGKNIHKINPDDLISITYKIHGTSAISSKVLVKRKLNWFEKLLKFFGVNIPTSNYDGYGIYSSRKVVQNQDLNPNTNDYYQDGSNWRKTAHEMLIPFMTNGMTLYYEIAGYTPNGSWIQKNFDYGCEVGEFKIFIYRITSTNTDGQVFEWSAKQVQDWCKQNELNVVPELYYGTTRQYLVQHTSFKFEDNFHDFLLEYLKKEFWLDQCSICKSKVPSEGIVLRKEGLGLEVFKYKNFKFLEYESKQLDSGETNIEDNEIS